MKIYVAAKFEEKELVRGVHGRLAKMGHEVTHDWTKEDLGKRTGVSAYSYLREAAIHDVEGVRNAQLLFLINHPQGFGLMVELGVAIGFDIPTIVVNPGARETPFFYMHNIVCVDTVEEGLAYVEMLTRKQQVGREDEYE